MYVDENELKRKGYEVKGYYANKLRELQKDLSKGEKVVRHASMRVENVNSISCGSDSEK